MTPVISIENLSKVYQIGTRTQAAYRTLRESLVDAAAAPWRRLRAMSLRDQPHLVDQASFGHSTHWALRDVSFEVQPGEVVGIMGRNGSGKSTLLKILSRITEPTNGRARLRGRLSSLLEVGTGFHPELTGRENVYLNGAIMGMTRQEVARQFDAIVDFSGVEEFLETPVKRYSSGMYVRLAFAVAAHLDPEILIVDEVLAVGDAEFQRKCINRMADAGRDGRTILFVSHNIGALQALCTRGVLLSAGQCLFDAPIDEAIDAYLRTIEGSAGSDLRERTDRRGKGPARIGRIDITGGDDVAALATGHPARFTFYVDRHMPGLACVFTIYDSRGAAVASFSSHNASREDDSDAASCPVIVCEMEELLLKPNRYRINAALMANSDCVDHIEGAAWFDVEPGQIRGRPAKSDQQFGSVFLPHRWSGRSVCESPLTGSVV